MGGAGDAGDAGEGRPARVLFCGVRGAQVREGNGDAPSYFNPVEAQTLVDLVERWVRRRDVADASGFGSKDDRLGARRDARAADGRRDGAVPRAGAPRASDAPRARFGRRSRRDRGRLPGPGGTPRLHLHDDDARPERRCARGGSGHRARHATRLLGVSSAVLRGGDASQGAQRRRRTSGGADRGRTARALTTLRREGRVRPGAGAEFESSRVGPRRLDTVDDDTAYEDENGRGARGEENDGERTEEEDDGYEALAVAIRRAAETSLLGGGFDGVGDDDAARGNVFEDGGSRWRVAM